MGVTRFLATSPDILPPGATERIYCTGFDGIPVAIWASWDDVLVIERETSDSGTYHIPWHVSGAGVLLLSTATLVNRDRPYRLALELARGTLSQLRNQASEWEEIGLTPPEQFAEQLHETTRLFATTATASHDLQTTESRATEVIQQCIELGNRLAAAFVEQAINVRKRQASPLPAWLGAALGDAVLDNEQARRFLASFNSAVVTLAWRDVEPTEGNYRWQIYDQQIAWCCQQNLPVVAGPVLKLDATGLPDWLCLWEGDFENLVQLVTDYVETAVARYRGKVNLWNCAGRFATGEAFSLSEEECLHLAARAVESTKRADPGTPLILTFDQPWAEYMRTGGRQLSPLHVADALLRSELGLSGIGLELNLGYWPGGSGLRSTLAISRLVDWWSSFGLPLYLFLTVPSSGEPDPKARIEIRQSEMERQACLPELQRDWAERIVGLCVAKPAVRGVFWNQWTDERPHDFPHGGLIDASRREKPALAFLRRFRRRHLA
jgi:hypothetical protein